MELYCVCDISNPKFNCSKGNYDCPNYYKSIVPELHVLLVQILIIHICFHVFPTNQQAIPQSLKAYPIYTTISEATSLYFIA